MLDETLLRSKLTLAELKLKAETYLNAKSEAGQLSGGCYGKDYYWMECELDGNSAEDLDLAKLLVWHLEADYDRVYMYTSKETGNYIVHASWRDRDYLRV